MEAVGWAAVAMVVATEAVAKVEAWVEELVAKAMEAPGIGYRSSTLRNRCQNNFRSPRKPLPSWQRLHLRRHRSAAACRCKNQQHVDKKTLPRQAAPRTATSTRPCPLRRGVRLVVANASQCSAASELQRSSHLVQREGKHVHADMKCPPHPTRPHRDSPCAATCDYNSKLGAIARNTRGLYFKPAAGA